MLSLEMIMLFVACGKGHQKVAEWLWKVCPDQEQSTMLRARDDYAFRVACGKGYQKIAKWLWKGMP